MPDLPEFRALQTALLTHPILRTHMKPMARLAGQHVIHQGDACQEIFVLRSGLVKIYYLTHEGKEWVKSFIPDSGLFGSRIAQAGGPGSAFAVTCIEDSEFMTIPYPRFLEAVLQDAELTRQILRFNEWLGLKKECREYDLLCRSAEDRYRLFITNEASLAARLTQVDIARYLGITPIALSRIKRRLAG